jgi:hypothetical protein
MATVPDEDGTLYCKKTGCAEEADVLLHGRFPFCEEHYLEVVKS